MASVSPDQHKFRLIYEEHYQALCRSAFRLLQDQENAREVVQDVFTDIWNKGLLNTIESPKAYLHVSVHNRCLKELRKRRQFVSEDAIPELLSHHESIVTDELTRIIEMGIDSLPEKCKQIFLLSRGEEMTYAQIAEYLQLSIKTVENQMGIALKKLRDYLDQHYSK